MSTLDRRAVVDLGETARVARNTALAARTLVLEELEAAGEDRDVALAAMALGVSRSTIYRRLRVRRQARELKLLEAATDQQDTTRN